MEVSYNWLKQYLPFALTPEDLGEILTNTGLEVEDIQPWESVKGGLKDVVIGEIISSEPHPNADKLKIALVNIGEAEPIKIVCGAPNCRAGLKSPVAKVGAVLYPVNASEPLQIKKSKIRGEESYGMICAEDELGIGESHAGIMELPLDTKVGTPAAEYFNVEQDYIITIGLTPNRSDAFSHIGVVRDLKAALAAVYNIKLDWKIPTANVESTFPCPVSVEILNADACKRYSGIYLKGIKPTPSPEWLVKRLAAIGVKSINSIVDVTNFVLHETGQPLHAFDAAKIKSNKIIVKTLPSGTKMTTLEGTERELNENDLIICDQANPLCIAGVYGGLDSGVTENTTDVFLESAFFDATFIRKTAARHALRTDASQHFEKTTNIEATVDALKRAFSLLAEISSFESSEIIDVYPVKHKAVLVQTSYIRINELAGTQLPKAKVDEILSDLGFVKKAISENEFELNVPAFKTEVHREADVVEEILRIYGYNTIPMPRWLKSSLSFTKGVDSISLENRVAESLIAQGFFEVSANSIVSSKYEQSSVLVNETVMLLNSQTAELDALRTSMIYGLLDIANRNINHKSPNVKLFEFGKTYHKRSEGYEQQSHLSLLMSGFFSTKNWLNTATASDFFHLKTQVQNLINKFIGNAAIDCFEQDELLSYGISFTTEGKELARIGKVKSSVLKAFDIKQDVFYADVNWVYFTERNGFMAVRFKELSKFPSVQRDISMILSDEKSFKEIEEIAVAQNRKLLREVVLFDVYKGDKIEQGKKSYAVSYTFQDDEKTLTDKEIDKAMNRIMEKLEQDLGAQIRKS
jgi:phenylalanyl-tRNA synthetase beta chain